MTTTPARYPLTFEVDYPERSSRLITLFRIILIIPLFVFAGILTGSLSAAGDNWRFGGLGLGGIVLAAWIAIVIRGSMPRWLFDFQVATYRFTARAGGYFSLFVDRYPPFDGDFPLRYDVPYPERVTRWKVLFWKIITAIPHFIVLFFLGIGALVALIISWFAIIITGRYPRGLFDFIVGVHRWSLRVTAYLVSLRDEYPPYSLSAEAGEAKRDTRTMSVVLGFAILALVVAGSVAAVVALKDTETTDVNYAALKAGTAQVAIIEVEDVKLALERAQDPAEAASAGPLEAVDGKRLIVFQFTVENERERDVKFRKQDFRIKDSEGDYHKAVLVALGDEANPAGLENDEPGQLTVVFSLDEDRQPVRLKVRPGFAFLKTIKYELK